MKQIISFLVLTVFMLGGVSESPAQDKPPEPFIELHKGLFIQFGRVTKKQTKIITSQEEYVAELGIYTSAPPASIDFTRGRVLLVDMGPRITGGYSIAVSSVIAGRNSVTANIQLTKPGDNCIVTLAITNPYQFVFIPSLEEILISETVKTARC